MLLCILLLMWLIVVYVFRLKVQLASAELLMLICSELIYIVRDSGKGFACYIADLLSRCKVQKVVLHCVLSSVYNMKSIANSQEVHSLKVCIEKPCSNIKFHCEMLSLIVHLLTQTNVFYVHIYVFFHYNIFFTFLDYLSTFSEML